jgi:hypothetical protein
MVGEIWVIDRAVVPIIWMPLWEDAVHVVAVDMWGQASVAPMPHSQAVETEPLCGHVYTHHITWTTPSDDNCRQAVNST